VKKRIVTVGKEQIVPVFVLDWICDTYHIKNIGSRFKDKGSRIKVQG
jgi:hypothetical protein